MTVAGVLLPGDGRETGALNGAGPERKVVFLCVCISEVTFLRPTLEIEKYISKYVDTFSLRGEQLC